MSTYKDFEKYLAGEWYPGCPRPRTEWGQSFDEYMRNKTVVPMIVAPKERQCKRVKGKPKAQYNKDYMRARRAAAIKSGTCADCYHGPARKGKTNCQACQDKRNVRESKRYLAKKAA